MDDNQKIDIDAKNKKSKAESTQEIADSGVSSTTNNSGIGNDEQPKQNKFDLKSLMKKRVVVISLALIILFGGSAAAYFGYVVPNKPENIWNSAMANTVSGYDKLVTLVDKTEQPKGYKLTANLKSEGMYSADGSFEAQSYENNGKFDAEFGMSGMRVNLEGVMIAEDNADPDLYLKASGLSAISQMFAGTEYADLSYLIDSIDDQWIYFDRTLLAQTGVNSVMDVQEDQQAMVDVLKAIGQVNRDYLFSSDKDKAVFDITENVGKEDKDGRSAYHYKVKANKDNLNKYVDELGNKLSKSDALEESQKTQLDKLIKNIKSSLEGDTVESSNNDIDLWVDLKTKLVRSVRISDRDNKDNYMELNMPYDGGDDFPLNLVLKTSEGETEDNVTMNFVFNPNTYKTSIDYVFDSTSGGENIKLTISLEGEPNNNKVDVTKPEGAKSVMEYLGLLIGGFEESLGGLPITSEIPELTL